MVALHNSPRFSCGPFKNRIFFKSNFIHNFIICIDTTVLARKFEADAENKSLGFISNPFFVNLTQTQSAQCPHQKDTLPYERPSSQHRRSVDEVWVGFTSQKYSYE